MVWHALRCESKGRSISNLDAAPSISSPCSSCYYAGTYAWSACDLDGTTVRAPQWHQLVLPLGCLHHRELPLARATRCAHSAAAAAAGHSHQAAWPPGCVATAGRVSCNLTPSESFVQCSSVELLVQSSVVRHTTVSDARLRTVGRERQELGAHQTC